MFCDAVHFGTLTLCAAMFVTLRHVTFTLCCFTLCSNIHALLTLGLWRGRRGAGLSTWTQVNPCMYCLLPGIGLPTWTTCHDKKQSKGLTFPCVLYLPLDCYTTCIEGTPFYLCVEGPTLPLS
jgi:hypothetical protein